MATTVVLFAALAGVTAVWLLSAWWSFAEQTRAATARGFEHPAVLPWTLDGLAVSLALVALAAALDGRPAPLARVGVLVALAGSVWANRLGVELRGGGDHADQLATVAPLSAFVAFEVILAAIRRLVMRWRGLPAPAPIPTLRPVRLVLAPVVAWREWRTAVLAATAPSLSADDRSALPVVGLDSAGPARGCGRAGGTLVDAAQDGPRVHATAVPLAAAGPVVDGGRVDAYDPIHPSAPRTSTRRRPVHRVAGWTPRRRPLPRSVHPSTRPQVDARVDVHPAEVDAGQDRTRETSTSPKRRRGGQDKTGRRPSKADQARDIMAELGVGKSRAYVLADDPAALARVRAARASLNGHAPVGTP